MPCWKQYIHKNLYGCQSTARVVQITGSSNEAFGSECRAEQRVMKIQPLLNIRQLRWYFVRTVFFSIHRTRGMPSHRLVMRASFFPKKTKGFAHPQTTQIYFPSSSRQFLSIDPHHFLTAVSPSRLCLPDNGSSPPSDGPTGLPVPTAVAAAGAPPPPPPPPSAPRPPHHRRRRPASTDLEGPGGAMHRVWACHPHVITHICKGLLVEGR